MTGTSDAVRDSATMLRRKLRHIARYPSMTLMLIGIPIIFLLAVRRRPRRNPRCRTRCSTWRPGRRPSPVRRPRHPRDHPAHRGRSGSGHGDLDRHGQARRHHRPIPHHGHRPLCGPDRPCPRQHPDTGRSGHRRRGGSSSASDQLPGRSKIAAIGLLVQVTLAPTWLSVGFGLISKSVETASNLPMFLYCCRSWEADSSRPTRCRRIELVRRIPALSPPS
jgi:hypothetical protein